ncbi:hypothetical protein [Marinobacter mangrovi]|uniref:hypothetical protein n=1 Tax=Marinobacter mangrovi TaxID=2803918 RepID=UPI001933670B|nr:hypothetical protein [Marinobacter mangrovi]
MVQKAFIPIVLATSLLSSFALAEESNSYLSVDGPIIQIDNMNREAEAWGTCSAAYDVMAMLLEERPAQAQQFKNYGNGAALAVVMAHVSDGLERDMSPEQFGALWNYSKTLSESIPETQKTMILADAENAGEKGSDKFVEKVANTVKTCISNLEGQQAYIDTWRELAKSGLLSVPQD